MDKILIYINQIGVDSEGLNIYEFMFGDSEDRVDVDGINWDVYPASGWAEPPIKYVKESKYLKTDLVLNLIQDSDTFSVWDSIDDVVALGWEETKHYDNYPDYRISFRFGDDTETINNKMFQKELEWSEIIE